MTNQEILEKLTLGKEATETVTINNVEITLRPLTSGELAKLQVLEKKGFTMKVGVNPTGRRQTTNNDIDINAGEFSKYQLEAMYKAVAWSMDITEEDVEQFEVGIPQKIFQEVIRISHITDEDLTAVKQFRKDE